MPQLLVELNHLQKDLVTKEKEEIAEIFLYYIVESECPPLDRNKSTINQLTKGGQEMGTLVQ